MADRGLHPNVEISNSGKREYKGRIYAFLRTSLRFGLAHRWSFVFAMIGLLALSIFGYGYMRQGFFPDMVYDQLYMEYKLPEGTNSTRVAHDLAEIENYLKGRKEITHITTSKEEHRDVTIWYAVLPTPPWHTVNSLSILYPPKSLSVIWMKFKIIYHNNIRMPRQIKTV